MSRRGTGEQPTRPKIWVGDLGAYNAGILHGRWIEAAQEPEEIQAEIDEMLAASPRPGAEEWAIFDQEGWGGLDLGEHEDLDTVTRVAKGIEEHGAMFAALVAHFGGAAHVDEAEQSVEDGYQGTFSDLADWAANYADDTGVECAEPWRQYIDFDRWGRDAELGGDIFTIDTPDGVAVFFSH
ncbi:MAG TPA: antirestriction protein ArdA [Polyangia bacterium]